MRRLLIPALLAGMAVLGFALPASAHNVLVGSTPTAGSSLAAGPSRVELDFNAPVQRGADVITVIGPDGNHWERTENATVNGDSVSTDVSPLGPAGQYKIGYRIISADGHPVSGEVTFTLTAAGSGKPVAPAANQAGTSAAGNSSGGGGIPVWVWIVGAVLVLGVALFVALRSGGRTEDDRS
jgi:hypothetical protein